MKIAFISDIHADFHVSAKLSGHKEQKKIETFVDDILMPRAADILIFAGDNSHYNNQMEKILKYLASKKIYKKIFVTFGNHDLYLISSAQESKYKLSWNKVIEMKEMCEKIDTVEFLDGNIVEVDGIKIGGLGMWYDFSYGKKNFGMDDSQMLQLWKKKMNDSNLIKGQDSMPELDDVVTMYGYSKMKFYSFDPLAFFDKELVKMQKIIEECDVFVSHVGPVVPPNIQPDYMDAVTGFYFFDGEQYLWNDKAPKVWIFGHTHDKYEFKVNNTWLMCNPLGYSSDNNEIEIEVIDLDTLH